MKLTFRQKLVLAGLGFLASTWLIEAYLYYYEPDLLKLWINRYVYFNPIHPTFGLSITTIIGIALIVYGVFFAKKSHMKAAGR